MPQNMRVRKSGLVVPDEQTGPPETQIQSGLAREQLPGFIQRLNDAGALVESVFFRAYNGIVGRYVVVYMHHESLECEIPC